VRQPWPSSMKVLLCTHHLYQGWPTIFIPIFDPLIVITSPDTCNNGRKWPPALAVCRPHNARYMQHSGIFPSGDPTKPIKKIPSLTKLITPTSKTPDPISELESQALIGSPAAPSPWHLSWTSWCVPWPHISVCAPPPPSVFITCPDPPFHITPGLFAPPPPDTPSPHYLPLPAPFSAPGQSWAWWAFISAMWSMVDLGDMMGGGWKLLFAHHHMWLKLGIISAWPLSAVDSSIIFL